MSKPQWQARNSMTKKKRTSTHYTIFINGQYLALVRMVVTPSCAIALTNVFGGFIHSGWCRTFSINTMQQIQYSFCSLRLRYSDIWTVLPRDTRWQQEAEHNQHSTWGSNITWPPPLMLSRHFMLVDKVRAPTLLKASSTEKTNGLHLIEWQWEWTHIHRNPQPPEGTVLKRF